MADSPIRVGGLISGLDVNSIVNALVKAESYRLQSIKKNEDYNNIKREVYKSIGDLVGKFKDSLFQLRLMSTYLTPIATSSNPSILGVRANSGASFGTYNIQVKQLAKEAITSSYYVRLLTTNSNVAGFSVYGRSTENVEGFDSISVNSKSGGYEVVWSFKPKYNSSINTIVGSAIEDPSNPGKLSVSLSAGDSLSFSYGGKNLSVILDRSYSNGDSIYDLAKDLEDKINRAINDAFGTRDYTYVMVRVDTDGTPGKGSIAVYDINGEGISFSGQVADTLGLTNGSIRVSDSVNSRIFVTDVTAINDAIRNYLIPGADVSGSLGDGAQVEVLRDASLKAQKATYSYLYGAKVSSGSGLNLNATLDNAGFAESPSNSTNGYFTINGVRIYIDDYRSLTVNDVLAKINSAGAGVLAYYDSANDRIVLRSTDPGGSIRIGSPTDTSNFLSIAKLTIPSGANYVPGTGEGRIDPTVPLINSGLTVTPTKGTFTINGVTLYVDPTRDSLNDLLNRIKNSASGVDAFYDQGLDKVVIVNKKNSNNSFITLGSPSDTSNILYALNLIPNVGGSYQVGEKGRDAIVNVNGVNYVRPTNEISDIVKGVTFELNGLTQGSTVTVEISPDVDSLVDKFADLISLYNQIVDKLNPPSLTDEMKKYLDPLSDDDKAQMTQSQIDDYEKKHKEYLSYKIISETSEFRNFLYKLRSAFTSISTGYGTFRSIYDLGLLDDYALDEDAKNKGFLLTNSTDKDKIKEILKNNDKFINALKNNTYDVYKLFVGENSDGVANKLYQVVNQYFGTTGLIYNYYKPGGYIDNIMAQLVKKEIDEVNRLNNYENLLWSKFTAMEEAISRMQAASQYLMAQLGSFNNNNNNK